LPTRTTMDASISMKKSRPRARSALHPNMYFRETKGQVAASSRSGVAGRDFGPDPAPAAERRLERGFR